MKKLEKKEMKSIQGGYGGCFDNGNGTTSCWVVYKNGWACSGTYKYSGETTYLECFQGI